MSNITDPMRATIGVPISTIIGNQEYIIKPMSVRKGARMTQKIMGILLSAISGLIPAIASSRKDQSNDSEESGTSVLDFDLDANKSNIVKAFYELPDDTLESIIDLVLLSGSISYAAPANNQHIALNREEQLDALFAGNLMQMYQLLFEAIKVNFTGTSASNSDLFGGLLGMLGLKKSRGAENT